MNKLGCLFSVIAVFLIGADARADVKLPDILSDHMVLQREMQVPIWGEATPNEKVTVEFRDQQKTVMADSKGKWTVKLDPLKAGGPNKMTISGANKIELDDVLVGEVWVGSGQSNMSMWVNEYTKNDPGLAQILEKTPYPQIRQFGVFDALRQPSCDGKWQIAEAQHAARFSAFLFAYGVRLQQELKVPVGLVLGAVSGSPSGYWLSKGAMEVDSDCQALIKKFAATWKEDPNAIKQYEDKMEQWKKNVAIAKEQKKAIPKEPHRPAKPGEGYAADIGENYETFIRPVMPYSIRGVLWDQGENGTAVIGLTDQYVLMKALIAGWRREWGQGEFPFIYVQKTTGGGCAWDYTNPVTAMADKYSSHPEVIAGGDSIWGSYLQMMNLPNTGMVVNSDLGGGQHPINKSAYGHRAGDVAFGMVYGKKVDYYGPIYSSHRIEGEKVRITFTHVGKGLAFKGGDKLDGFALSAEGQRYIFADAVIEGDTVVVWSPKVPKPVSVWYGWSSKRPWANLFNKDGLPAIPFKTEP